jgi:hypothetical protein
MADVVGNAVTYDVELAAAPAKTIHTISNSVEYESSLGFTSETILFQKSHFIESNFYDYSSRADLSLPDLARLDLYRAGPLGVRFDVELSSPPAKTRHVISTVGVEYIAELSAYVESLHYSTDYKRDSENFETSARLDRAMSDFSRLDRVIDLPLGVNYVVVLGSTSEAINTVYNSIDYDVDLGTFSYSELYQKAVPRDTNSFDSSARLDRAIPDLSRADRFRFIPSVKINYDVELSSFAESSMYTAGAVEYDVELSAFVEGITIHGVSIDYDSELSSFSQAGTQRIISIDYDVELSSYSGGTRNEYRVQVIYDSTLSAYFSPRHFVGQKIDYISELSGYFVSRHQVKNSVTYDSRLDSTKLALYGHRFIEFDVVLYPGDVLTIDSNKFAALLNSTNVLHTKRGDFIFLIPGENTLRYVDRSTGREAQVQVSYEERYA